MRTIGVGLTSGAAVGGRDAARVGIGTGVVEILFVGQRARGPLLQPATAFSGVRSAAVGRRVDKLAVLLHRVRVLPSVRCGIGLTSREKSHEMLEAVRSGQMLHRFVASVALAVPVAVVPSRVQLVRDPRVSQVQIVRRDAGQLPVEAID